MEVPSTLKVLYTAEQIAEKCAELGARISEEYTEGRLVLVGVLKGAFPFLADLCRNVTLPVSVDFLGVSSYAGGTETTGVVRITSDLSQPLSGMHVLVVEDIVDTGLTLRYILENLQTRGPRSIDVCALLDKPANRRVEVPVKYTGFTIPNHFVVGYGLDLDERYRNLSYIGYFDPPSSATIP